MLYVTDIERAVLAAAENIQSCQGKIYNVGGGVDRIISVGQAATSLCAATGVSRIPGAARKNDDNLFVTDHAKFTAATGWQPQVDVADGMARVLAWAQQNASDLRLLYL
jgi:CDP-paratose 2-epimerase